ncbi:uncharacterized protein LOC126810572 [Patella vulgata]|uniref:uncharacterized protein LOC126810572 n=1 Tax=Patella vulgata TaxID=6465 RepID=UPI00217FFB31|nr:uncharacterized protein LOC126810572 [Patella vulgata]
MQCCNYISSSSFRGELDGEEISRVLNEVSKVEDANLPYLMFKDIDTHGLIPDNEVDIQTSEILEFIKLPEQSELPNESYPNHLGSTLKSDTKAYPEILDLDLYRNQTSRTGYPDSCISNSHFNNILKDLQMCDDNACSLAPRKHSGSNPVSDPSTIINLSCAPNKTDESHQAQVKMGNSLSQKSADTKKNIIDSPFENPQNVTHNRSVLRKRLSIKIKERRKQEGKDEFIPDFSSRPTFEPSDEEKRKSQDLKMRNLKSANRSRDNMKLKVKKLEESIRYYEESNSKLESKIKEYEMLLANRRQWLVRHGVGGNIDPNSNNTINRCFKSGISSSSKV